MSIILVDPPLGPVVVAADVPYPVRRTFTGTSVTLEPLAVSHVPDLWVAAGHADASWTYLRYGPFGSESDLHVHVGRIGSLPLQPFFAILPAVSGKAEGWASFCDIAPGDTAIEIGSIWFSPRLQRTRAATEAIYLMLDHVFGLGYRRVAWRCNALNAASMRAAERFGFTHEGTWRAAEIVKGRRRDTAWFSIVEEEWAERRARFVAWLDDGNFDADGVARRGLR